MRAKRVVSVLLAVTATAGLTLGIDGSASAKPAADDLWQCEPPWRADGSWCTTTKTGLNMREEPNQNAYSPWAFPPNGQAFIECWTTGENIYGDNVWYLVENYNNYPDPDDGPGGYVTGYYLNTGKDPNAAIRHC